MKKILTKEFMQENCGCYSQERLMSLSFMQKGEINLSSIINSEISLKDKYWFVCKKLASKEQNQQIGISVSEIVLPIYENRYPENKAPREAIDAAKQYIAGHISFETLIEKRKYAYTAARAAARAAAYYGAADAPYYSAPYYSAAYFAATAASDAAYAAYYSAAYVAATAYDADPYAAAAAYATTYEAYSADAATDAASAEEIKEKLFNYLIEITNG